MRLVACNAAAFSLGIRPGLTLADARARLPNLTVRPHDAQADGRWLERIMAFCDRYSPMVSPDLDDGVTLDITGCDYLFGGESGLAEEARQRITERGLQVQLAFSDTPEGAQGLARHHGRRVPAQDEAATLRGLPIAALRLEADDELALRRAGLRTIGDLASRPTAPLAARFGENTVFRLKRLVGDVDSRITPVRVPPALSFACRFAEPLLRVQDVLQVIERLLREAALALDRRGMGGRIFIARLFRSDGEMRDLSVETGLPVRDPARLLRLFSARIDALADPIDFGFGFDVVRLMVPILEPLAEKQLGLEGEALDEDALASLVDRLSTHFGAGRVRRFASQDTHIPERAARALPALDLQMAAWSAPGMEAGEPPLRPVHLFNPPHRIEVTAEVPEGPPRQFRWRGTLHEVILQEGPERIGAEWWRHLRNSGLTRDYYRVEDRQGRRFWIFRNGLYDGTQPGPEWFLHGLFA